jgi:hypothetical protein
LSASVTLGGNSFGGFGGRLSKNNNKDLFKQAQEKAQEVLKQVCIDNNLSSTVIIGSSRLQHFEF